MILLTKDKSNIVALTLNEKSEIFSSGLTPYFLFEFINDQSHAIKYFNPVFRSLTSQVNVFTIVEANNENLTGGTVSLVPGFYSYNVYEQFIQYNLSLSGTYSTNIIESGKCKVITSTGNTMNVFTSTGTTNFVYYN